MQDVLSSGVSERVHYILSGTFNTLCMYVLAFTPAKALLEVSHRVQGNGPHQYLALDGHRSTAYATTWAQPPELSSWRVLEGGSGGVELLNTVPITATSSYISTWQDKFVYSAGGPTGELHRLDPETHAFGEKLQQFLYVDSEEQLEKEDKTRVALRYGSHGIDISSRNQVFVPHLGHNSIFMYDLDAETGMLTEVANVPSYGDGHDAPRHNVPSPDGNFLFAVTEHTSFVDVYRVLPKTLKHVQRVSVLPNGANPADYRGDTLRFSQSGRYLYATTRGKTTATKGILTAWKVDYSSDNAVLETATPVRYTTPASGGKANAIEPFPFHGTEDSDSDWIVLTDDDEGFVEIVAFDGERFSSFAHASLTAYEGGEFTGGSHAVWLS